MPPLPHCWRGHCAWFLPCVLKRGCLPLAHARSFCSVAHCAVRMCLVRFSALVTRVCQRIRILLSNERVVSSFRFSLHECACERLCANKVIITMMEDPRRNVPVSTLATTLPQRWRFYFSSRGLPPKLLWTSSSPSIRLFTVRVSLPALLSHAREATLYIGLGARIDLRPAASSVELRHRFAVVFTLRRGWCSQVEWCSHVGSLRTTQIQPLDFRPPSCFSFRITDLAFELFGPSISPANLISKFDFPTRLFFPTQDRMCLFACLHANDVASVDHDDALSWVQPIAPLLEEARAVQHRLSIASNSQVCWADVAGGCWEVLPQACQLLTMEYFAELARLLRFIPAHRLAADLLSTAVMGAGLPASLSPCSCARFCLSQALQALLQQGFPLRKQLVLSPHSFPSRHRGWQAFQSIDLRHIVWMAERLSPCVSTVVISLSHALRQRARLQIGIGFSTADAPATVAWPDLFSQQDPFQQCGIQLYLVESVCQVAAWRTETTIFQRHSIPNLDFASQQRFTVLCTPPNFALFDSRGSLITRFVAPDVWGHAALNKAKAFITFHSADGLPRPARDIATVVQPIMTRTSQAQALTLQPLIQSQERNLYLRSLVGGAAGSRCSQIFPCVRPWCICGLEYTTPRPYEHKLGCIKWIKLSVPSVAAGATCGAKRLRWCDTFDSDSPSVPSSPVIAASLIPATSTSPSSRLSDEALSDASSRLFPVSLANQLLSPSDEYAQGAWANVFVRLLAADCKVASFFRALQFLFSLPTSHLAQSCAALTLQSHAWQHFFSQPTTHIDALPFPFVLDLIVYLECGTVLLWILPAGDLFTVDSRSIHPCQHSVTQFPCVAFNAANSRFLPARHSNPIRVPSFPTSAAIGYLQVLLFGLAPCSLPGTENLFWCFKTTRLDCVHHLETLQHTVSLSLCRCLRPMGRPLCGRGLSQLCLVLAPEQHVDLIVLDSNSCLFHVSPFHAFEPISWSFCLRRLLNPNCFFSAFNHSTQHFVQGFLQIPASENKAESWLGQPQPTARAAVLAPIPILLADPVLAKRLSSEGMRRFQPCVGGAIFATRMANGYPHDGTECDTIQLCPTPFVFYTCLSAKNHLCNLLSALGARQALRSPLEPTVVSGRETTTHTLPPLVRLRLGQNLPSLLKRYPNSWLTTPPHTRKNKHVSILGDLFWVGGEESPKKFRRLT